MNNLNKIARPKIILIILIINFHHFEIYNMKLSKILFKIIYYLFYIYDTIIIIKIIVLNNLKYYFK